MTVLKYASVFASLLVFTGCLQSEDEPRCPESECGPFAYREGLFPLAVGNSWIFTDTAIVEDSDSIGSFVVSVREWHPEEPFGQWNVVFDSVSDPTRQYQWIYSQYGRDGDSVYSLQYGWGESQGSSSLQYVVPSGADTIRYLAFFGGDVGVEIAAVRLQDSYQVPAGRFDDCVAYSYETIAEHRDILCPDVGWVAFDVNGRRIRLAEYSLVR